MLKNIFAVFVLFLSLTSFVFAEDDKKEEVTKEKSSMFENISFEEGTFLGNLNDSVVKLVVKIEKWREKQSVSFKESLEKTEDKRQENKDAKSLDKVLIMAHLVLLAIILFVFSMQVVFYAFAILIAFALIRKIFSFVKRIFRREDVPM